MRLPASQGNPCASASAHRVALRWFADPDSTIVRFEQSEDPTIRNSPITAAAITLCLAVGTTPVMAQDADAEPSPSPATIGLPTDDGARIVLVEDLGGRTRDLTIDSPAVGAVKVRLLLPEAFQGEAAGPFSVLYLLHGGGGGYVDWTKETDVDGITAETDLLVAMPDAASSNMGTFLPGGGPDGSGGPPNWERFHLIELPELLELNWRAGEQRVIGGLSLGGWGAVLWAARNPGLFEAVASYSGALDLTVSVDDSDEARALVDRAYEIAEEIGLTEANPINLVPALEGTDMYISYGNGEPGPLDDPDREHDPLEDWIGRSNESFVAALAEQGIPATVNAYGPGTHSWPYWERELEASLPTLLEALGED